MSKIWANVIKTPDGTILQSYHRHDYKSYRDKISDEIYTVDGGIDYLRRSVNTVPFEDWTITEDDDHEVIREWFHWGVRSSGEVKWVPMKRLSNDHISAILDTQHHISSELRNLFIYEMHYRKVNEIHVPDGGY